MDDREKKARKLCELRGLDPDKEIGHGADTPGMDVMMFSPRWERVALEIDSFEQIRQACDGSKSDAEGD